MLNGLNRFGLPIKYAIVLAVVVPLGRLASQLLGFGGGADVLDYLSGAAIGAVFGYVVGYFRERRGETS